MTKKRQHWSPKELLTVARKYTTRKQWQIKSAKTYLAAYRVGKPFFNSCCKHMVENRMRWSMDALFIEALKYKTRHQWQEKSGKTYIAAYRRGKAFFEMCCSHMKGNKRKWTDAEILTEAAKHKEVTRWKAKSRRSYAAALQRGKSFYRKCISHMKVGKMWKTDKKILSEIKKYCK